MSTESDLPSDPLDGLLTQAMRERRIDAPGVDIAAEARHLVPVQDERAARLLQLGRWIRLSGLAAGLLVILTIAFVYVRLPKDSSSSTDSGQVSVELSSSSNDAQSPALILLGTAIVGLAVAAVMRADRAL